ncbi:hypothetical protein CEXT_445261 [Caerostris extrusa]|uniref:Uncharacterized protein n=1 Tax=Caerostris extrusa TaxID=172846 RepID=A0AAV4XF77_CAEEX|nr:hypothetical protein CEXT_445261 [Caerostris extrusa]
MKHKQVYPCTWFLQHMCKVNKCTCSRTYGQISDDARLPNGWHAGFLSWDSWVPNATGEAQPKTQWPTKIINTKANDSDQSFQHLKLNNTLSLSTFAGCQSELRDSCAQQKRRNDSPLDRQIIADPELHRAQLRR